MTPDILFLRELYSSLDKENISYCILRKADILNTGVFNDIDWAVDYHYISKFWEILNSVCKKLHWKLFMNIKKDGFQTVHLYYSENCVVSLLHFDLFNNFSWHGIRIFKNEELLSNPVIIDGFCSVSSDIEAMIQLFTRYFFNGYIKDEYKENIKYIFKERKNKVLSKLIYLMGNKNASIFYNLVILAEWKQLENKVKFFQIAIKKHFGRKNPVEFVKEQIVFKWYQVIRLFKKHGCMLVFEGSDGSGKSTIIDNMPQILYRSFKEDNIDYYHWRPGFIKSPKTNSGSKGIVTNPHRDKSYNKVISLGKFIFFNIDYILGYWIKVRPQLLKGRMVIFDRYYYDYYIDKYRYRFDIEDYIFDLFLPLIPKPEVTFLLIGDPKLLYQRKKELTVTEIEKQNNRLIKSADKFKNAQIINVNKSIKDLVDEVSTLILETMSKRIEKR